MKKNQIILISAAAIALALVLIILRQQSPAELEIEQAPDNLMQGESLLLDEIEIEETTEFEQPTELKQPQDDSEDLNAEEPVDLSGEPVVDDTETASTTNPEVLGTEDKPEGQYTFFYGDTCPYCHDVTDWFEENKIEEQINLIRREVYNNPAHNQQLQLAAQTCGNTSGGVPFLFTPEKDCVVGSTPIIDYLTEKYGF